MEAMADESAEIFDDLYLGLRAGGALRKQRRGEPLTPRSRKRSAAGSGCPPGARPVAVGGFAIGTFGLGFTLGGLVFGRWRKPEHAHALPGRVVPERFSWSARC